MNKSTHFSALILLLIGSGCLTFAATPALAQIYKWVDERGVVNYGNQPQDNRKAKELDTSSITLSVYEAPKPRQGAEATGSEVASLSKKIDKLERQLEAEHQARRDMAEADARANQLAYDQCVAERGVDCNDLYSRTYPLGAITVLGRRAHRLQVVSSFPMSVSNMDSGHVRILRASHPLLVARTRAISLK
jgi:Domain of unknown function (DUF4124)